MGTKGDRKKGGRDKEDRKKTDRRPRGKWEIRIGQRRNRVE